VAGITAEAWRITFQPDCTRHHACIALSTWSQHGAPTSTIVPCMLHIPTSFNARQQPAVERITNRSTGQELTFSCCPPCAGCGTGCLMTQDSGELVCIATGRQAKKPPADLTELWKSFPNSRRTTNTGSYTDGSHVADELVSSKPQLDATAQPAACTDISSCTAP
jgi:hypothetical protein